MSWQESMLKFITRDDGTLDPARLKKLTEDLEEQSESGYAQTIEQTQSPRETLQLNKERAEFEQGLNNTSADQSVRRGREVSQSNTAEYGKRAAVLGDQGRQTLGQLIDYRKGTGDQFDTTHNKLLDLEYEARDKDRNLATMGLLANAVPSVMAALTLFG